MKRQRVTMEVELFTAIGEAIAKAKEKEKFCLSGDTRIVSCCEAARDGLWLHRYLLSIGIQNQVLDPIVAGCSSLPEPTVCLVLDSRHLEI